jgi:hypothetical protein
MLGRITGMTVAVAVVAACTFDGGGQPPPNIVPSSASPPPTGQAQAPPPTSPSPPGQTPPDLGIQPSDCLPYAVASLRIGDGGATGWFLTDGTSRMVLLDNQADARSALALAQRHTAHCFIGRDNPRPNRNDYIIGYWAGSSGRRTTIAKEDCIAYRTASLRIVDQGATGWLLTDGLSRMNVLDNQQDAANALTLARQFSRQCFIGRNNTRPDRTAYIVQYWQ